MHACIHACIHTYTYTRGAQLRNGFSFVLQLFFLIQLFFLYYTVMQNSCTYFSWRACTLVYCNCAKGCNAAARSRRAQSLSLSCAPPPPPTPLPLSLSLSLCEKVGTLVPVSDMLNHLPDSLPAAPRPPPRAWQTPLPLAGRLGRWCPF
jgi:hypothetical protein